MRNGSLEDGRFNHYRTIWSLQMTLPGSNFRTYNKRLLNAPVPVNRQRFLAADPQEPSPTAFPHDPQTTQIRHYTIKYTSIPFNH